MVVILRSFSLKLKTDVTHGTVNIVKSYATMNLDAGHGH